MTEKLFIEYGVMRNRNDRGRGWLPIVWEFGKPYGNEWGSYDYPKEDALELAKIEANERRANFIGDWDIDVRERQHDDGMGRS